MAGVAERDPTRTCPQHPQQGREGKLCLALQTLLSTPDNRPGWAALDTYIVKGTCATPANDTPHEEHRVWRAGSMGVRHPPLQASVSRCRAAQNRLAHFVKKS